MADDWCCKGTDPSCDGPQECVTRAALLIEAQQAEIERLRKRLQACQSNDSTPLTDDLITQNERVLLAENERLRRTVQDRDEWNEHLASRESSLLLAVLRPFRTWVDRRARKEARRG